MLFEIGSTPVNGTLKIKLPGKQKKPFVPDTMPIEPEPVGKSWSSPVAPARPEAIPAQVIALFTVIVRLALVPMHGCELGKIAVGEGDCCRRQVGAG